MNFAKPFLVMVCACLLMVSGATIRAQQGESKMKCVAVGKNGNVWAINDADRIFHWNGSSWDEPTPSARLKQISVGEDGTLWGVNSADQIWRFEANTWIQLPGALKHVSTGNASVIWGVNSADQIWSWTGQWNSISGGLSQVDAASDGSVWGVSGDGKIWRRDGNTWTNIPGGLIHVSVGSANQVWGVNSANQIWHWVNNNWESVPGGLKQIDAAADGSVWGVNSANQVWQYAGTGWNEIVPNATKAVSAKAKTVDGTNLALGKPCTQSSRSQWSNNEQGAVDGTKNGSFGFHTGPGPAWWQVDLGASYALDNVVIFNRTDCCAERARTIQVLVSDDGTDFRTVHAHNGSVFGGIVDGKQLDVAMNGATARYVRLQITTDDMFHLDEVEVYGAEAAVTSRFVKSGELENLALGGVASSSGRSQWSPANDPQGGNDGVKNGNFGFHTDLLVNPWWQVDLGAPMTLDKVVLYNRQDACSDRSRTVQVLISADGVSFQNVYTHSGTIFGGVQDGHPLSVSLNHAVARYVRLQLNERNHFHLDEVEVYGTSAGGEAVVSHGSTNTSSQSVAVDDQTAVVDYSQSQLKLPKELKMILTLAGISQDESDLACNVLGTAAAVIAAYQNKSSQFLATKRQELQELLQKVQLLKTGKLQTIPYFQKLIANGEKDLNKLLKKFQ